MKKYRQLTFEDNTSEDAMECKPFDSESRAEERVNGICNGLQGRSWRAEQEKSTQTCKNSSGLIRQYFSHQQSMKEFDR